MIAIISATEDEISPFIGGLTNRSTETINSVNFILGSLLDIEIVVCITGVGIKKAKNSVNTLLKKYKPGLVVSAGFAGALNPKLKLGDLVISESTVSLKQDGEIRLFTELPYIASKYIKGKILTENSFINSRKKKLDLFVKSSADIVDMETWPVAEIAEKEGINLVSVRAVSDVTSHELPRMEKIFNNKSKIDLKKSVDYFSSNPLDTFKFLKFKYIDLRKARIRLNSFLNVLVPVLNTVKN